MHALDLSGFGWVPHPKSGRMTISEYADLVGTVIDELGLDDPVLVGHSMGTQVVVDLASRYPDGFLGSAVTWRRPAELDHPAGTGAEPGRAHPRSSRTSVPAGRPEGTAPRVAVLAVQAYLSVAHAIPARIRCRSRGPTTKRTRSTRRGWPS